MIKNLKSWFIKKFNNHFGKKSFEQANRLANIAHKNTGRKMYIVCINGEFVAISKKEFKTAWKKNPAMKTKSLKEWQKVVYEFKPAC